MTSPNIPPSVEGFSHELKDALTVKADWDARFSLNGAEFRALGAELANEQDPQRILELTEQRGEALIRTFGSGALSLFKRDVLAERAEFETEFGDR